MIVKKKINHKKFSEYLLALKPVLLSVSGKIDFIPKSFTSSSKNIEQGSVFVAIKGRNNDGHLFIRDAIKSGASAIVFENESLSSVSESDNVAMIKVLNSHSAHEILLENFYDFLSSKLRLIGVTGTNGKTTCAFLLRRFLSDEIVKSGLISTVEYSFPGYSHDASRTTPSLELLQELFFNMSESGCSNAVMEVSSHGLDQRRIGNAKFAAAIFTNLSGDHLDYHKNMEDYFRAKKKLFENHLAKNAIAISNSDNIYGRRLLSEIKDIKILSCGFAEDANAQICDFENTREGLQFSLNIQGKTYQISSNLCGRYNAMNIAESFLLALQLGVTPLKMIEDLKNGIHVPGRLEKFRLNNGAIAFVDYAHTDDALEKVLSTLAEMKKSRLICVFGCGGDRDKSKRSRMGAISAKFADLSIITSDNPRSEDPREIIREILVGIKGKKNTINILDRREAIRTAVEMSKENDIIVIAGKGHEKGQQIGDEIFPFDDREELASFAIGLDHLG